MDLGHIFPGTPVSELSSKMFYAFKDENEVPLTPALRHWVAIRQANIDVGEIQGEVQVESKLQNPIKHQRKEVMKLLMSLSGPVILRLCQQQNIIAQVHQPLEDPLPMEIKVRDILTLILKA